MLQANFFLCCFDAAAHRRPDPSSMPGEASQPQAVLALDPSMQLRAALS